MRVVEEIEAGAFGNVYKGSSLNELPSAIAEAPGADMIRLIDVLWLDKSSRSVVTKPTASGHERLSHACSNQSCKRKKIARTGRAVGGRAGSDKR